MLNTQDVHKNLEDLKNAIDFDNFQPIEKIKLKMELLKLRMEISLWQIQKQKGAIK